MADITLGTFPYVDGAATVITNIDRNFYDPKGVPDSFDVINGFLNTPNLDAAYGQITYEQVARQTFSKSEQASGTANLDYFDYWYRNVTATPVVDIATWGGNYIPIAGAQVKIYCPWQARLLFVWDIAWSNTSSIGGQSVLRFFLNGVSPVPNPTRREVGSTFWGPAPPVYKGRDKARHYEGHYLTGLLPKGYHTGGLSLLSDLTVFQTRIHCRSIKVIAIRSK